ncbi:MAG: hypothetical protein PVH63_03625 [Balneolaceae bacterium]
MKQLFKRLSGFVYLFSLLTLLQACAGSGMASTDNMREYNQDFKQMQKIVDQAIGATNIVIDDIARSQDKVVMTISRSTYTNNTITQQEHGKVIITKLGDEKTSVEVQDPEYEFSVPDHQREHYKRYIFRQIDVIMRK